MTPEEANLTGQLNMMVENSLSSVEITHTTKGDTWKVKAYHADVKKAKEDAFEVEKEIRERYGNRTI